MKLLLVLCVLIGSAMTQSGNPAAAQSHFTIRGVQTNPQTGRLQASQTTNVNTRSSSRFATSARGQRVINNNNNNNANRGSTNFRQTSNAFQPSAQFAQSSSGSFFNNNNQFQQTRPTTRRITTTPRPTTPRPTTQAPTTTTANSGRLLAIPEIQSCINRPKQWQFNGKNYFFSWDQEAEVDPVTGQGEKVDWLQSRNRCRKYCMDSIGIESDGEWKMVQKFMQDRNLKYIWTSGRLCDFTGCAQRKDLHPLNIFGWFWSDTNTKAAATNSTPPGWEFQPWSHTGHTNDPQPDNAEFAINRTPESCLAVLNGIYKDGIRWHDIACYHKKPFICEDSKLLLDYMKTTNPDEAHLL